MAYFLQLNLNDKIKFFHDFVFLISHTRKNCARFKSRKIKQTTHFYVKYSK